MKSKKLLAILTILALMMTLLPMAAFAAAVSATAATVTLDKNAASATSVTYTIDVTVPAVASGDTLTLILTDSSDTAVAGVWSGAAGDVTLKDDNGTAVPAANATIAATSAAGTITITGGASGLAAGDYQIIAAASTNPVAGTYKIKDTTAGGITLATFTISDANRFASVASVNKTSATANGTDSITLTVYALNNLNQPVAGATIIAASNRVGADVIKVGSTTTNTAVTDANGKAEFKFSSSIAGSAKIAASVGENTPGVDLVGYLQGATGKTADDAGLVQAFDVTFGAAAANTIAMSKGTDGVVANGVATVEVIATVRDSGGNPIANQKVDFAVDKAGFTLSTYTATTNAIGQAKTKVSGTSAGTVTVSATSGSKSGTIGVSFVAGGAYDLSLVAGADQKVALNSAPSAIKFRIVDINGNKLPAPVFNNYVANADVTFFSKPTGSSLADSDLTVSDEAGTDYVIVNWAKNPDQVGTYVVRLALGNGKAATCSLEVAEQGTVVGATISYVEKTLTIGATTGAPSVKLVDAAGIGVTEPVANFTWSSSNNSLATVASNGTVTAVGGANANKSGTVTITAVHNVKKFVATTTIDIAKAASSLKVTQATGAEVGQNGTVAIQLVDEDGSNVAFNPANQNNVTLDVKVVSKPADAIVSTSLPAAVDYQKALVRTGATTFTVTSDKPGKVQLAITASEAAAGPFYTAITDVEFGAAKVAVGAKNVTMFIGAPGYTQDGTPKVTDVAPFIKDNRTFVAVRPIAEAFAAEIGWDEATQTVTLTRDDIAVTIVIGSNAISVVRNGVTSTVTADVPAYIVNGRTVLPFRAVGEAFGATVNYDAVTQSVSFVQ